jgi:hypothetical protein
LLSSTAIIRMKQLFSARGMPRVFGCVALGIMPLLGGCAAIPISMIAEGADAGIGMATGNARSYTYPRADVHAASLEAFRLMQIDVTRNQEKGEKIKIHGKTNHLKVALTLTAITPTLTKASIKVKKNWFSRDATVEAETLLQINRALRTADKEKSGPANFPS